MQNPRNPIPQIVVMVETSRGYARDILRGIMQYEVLHGPWDIHAIPGGRDEQHFPGMSRGGVKGIIAHITSRRMSKEIREANLPTVSVFPTDDIPGIDKQLRHYAEVRCDSSAIGRIAGQYLLERHFPHYGFVGELYNADWSAMRRDAFIRTIAEAGYSTHVYSAPSRSSRNWDAEQNLLIKWLRSLPKPIGIFTAYDIRGRRVIDACHKTQLAIPDQVAVLGVDNDELFCETCTPRLSSVALDSEKAGFEAAGFLDELMRGSRKKLRATHGPTRVVSRRSSDFFCADDKFVREALGFIRAYCMKPIGVPDVVKACDISRRHLEIRFKQTMGHSIMEEIRKRRLDKVKVLLIETDLSLERIAELCGFQSKFYLANIFRKEFNMTSSAYRAMHRLKSNPSVSLRNDGCRF